MTTLQREQAVATQADSRMMVETLLDVGIGSIAWLRCVKLPQWPGLTLAAACFRTTPSAPRSALHDLDRPDTHRLEAGSSSNPLSVMRMQRGKSSEADKLIDLIEHGVRDAIDKGYLKQLVLAIFVDPEDTTNVIETYTFNFSYSNLEVDQDDGTTTTARVPTLEIRDELRNLSLGGSEAADSTSKKRKRSSLGEIKRQVQLLIKRCARVLRRETDRSGSSA